MKRPAFRWQAGVSLLATGSDRFGGADAVGWFAQAAPRVLIERPPARFGGWLAFEPAFTVREAGSASELEPTSVQLQGSGGLRVGRDSGPRLAIDGGHRYSMDAVRAEDEGLIEHTETRAAVTTALVAPQRGNLSLRGQGAQIRYPSTRYAPGDHDRVQAILDANARILLRSTVGIRLHGAFVEYPRPPEGTPRIIETGAVLATLGAQLTPSVAVHLEGGPEARREEAATTISVPVSGGLTFDVKRRVRAELLAGAATEDSLWRSNTRVQVISSQVRMTTDVVRDLGVSGHAGIAQARYPRGEQTGNDVAPIIRTDLTWTAGGALSYHPQAQFRATIAYDRIQRSSTFPGEGWGENRCSLSANFTW